MYYCNSLEISDTSLPYKSVNGNVKLLSACSRRAFDARVVNYHYTSGGYVELPKELRSKVVHDGVPALLDSEGQEVLLYFMNREK